MAWGHRLWEMWKGGVTNQGIKVSDDHKHTRSRPADRRVAFVAKNEELIRTYGFNMARRQRRRIAWDSLKFRNRIMGRPVRPEEMRKAMLKVPGAVETQLS